MVDSGACPICGKPIVVDAGETADVDMETGSLVHASCIGEERTADEGPVEPEPSSQR
jgi:hypothetical protein